MTSTTTTLPSGVTMTSRKAKNQRDTFTPGHTRYSIILHYGGRSERFEYQENPSVNGWRTKPDPAEVLYCLVLDLRYEDPDEFDEIAGDLPFSEARKQFDAIKRQAGQMRALFGADLDLIVDEVEGWEL